MKLLKKIHIIRIIVFIIGLVMCAYPLVSSLVQWHYQSTAVKTYEQENEALADSEIKRILEQAEEYNRILYEVNPMYTGVYDEAFNEKNYNATLNPYGNGVMGSVEIPSIGVYLPIYHGTDDDVLSNAIGHVQESSFPIGGKNTRCIITGHRGSPVAQLFTRLDELVVGDLFYLHVLNETLAYEVIEIEVIDPEAIEMLAIEDGKDLVTLMTCTPYGINSHRLIITAERTIYDESEYDTIAKKMPSFREQLFVLIPVGFLCIGTMQLIKHRRKKGGKAYGK